MGSRVARLAVSIQPAGASIGTPAQPGLALRERPRRFSSAMPRDGATRGTLLREKGALDKTIEPTLERHSWPAHLKPRTYNLPPTTYHLEHACYDTKVGAAAPPESRLGVVAPYSIYGLVNKTLIYIPFNQQ